MVQIGEISFCNKIAFNIKSDETKKYILNHLDNKYKLKIITKHFEKFEPKLISVINNNPHMICVRSNGNPYFLYLTKINFVNYCIFIDKKIQQGYFYPRMIISNYHFDETLFDDTIFDGEMIQNKNKWVFLINDLIVYKGLYLQEQNLIKRLNTLYSMLQSDFIPDIMDVSRIQVKKYFKYDDINKIINEYIPTLDYTCRGLYFKPLFLKFKDILVNFDDNLIKKVNREKFKNVKNFLLLNDCKKMNNNDETLSESSSNSSQQDKETTYLVNNDKLQLNKEYKKIFYTRKTNNPDIYELYDNNSKYIDIACINTMKISKYMRELFSKANIIDKIEVNYEYSDKFRKWIPVII